METQPTLDQAPSQFQSNLVENFHSIQPDPSVQDQCQCNGGGVIQKHQVLHLTIPISLHVFQAVRNERAPWLSCQMQFLTTSNHKVASSIPTSVAAKQNRKNSSVPNVKFLGVSPENLHTIADVAQRQSVYNIVGHNFRLLRVRKTDGYRLISGRSQDRNLSSAYISIRQLYRSCQGVGAHCAPHIRIRIRMGFGELSSLTSSWTLKGAIVKPLPWRT